MLARVYSRYKHNASIYATTGYIYALPYVWCQHRVSTVNTLAPFAHVCDFIRHCIWNQLVCYQHYGTFLGIFLDNGGNNSTTVQRNFKLKRYRLLYSLSLSLSLYLNCALSCFLTVNWISRVQIKLRTPHRTARIIFFLGNRRDKESLLIILY